MDEIKGKLFQQKYQTCSNRWKTWDYDYPSWYFITVCSYRQQHIFGELIAEEVSLNQYGKIVVEEWMKTEHIRREIDLDEFIVMPNHLHAIVGIDFKNYKDYKSDDKIFRLPRSISTFISGFKASVTKRIKWLCADNKMVVWQSNYYDHVIRNEHSLQQIRKYIKNNPVMWKRDKLNVETHGMRLKNQEQINVETQCLCLKTQQIDV